MTGENKGSLEVRSRAHDTSEGPISEAYIQHWFQEEFLRLFYEDPEFREQVLKCLLTGDDDESTAEVRKPRRTWFNGIGETMEISCEEARYLHHCGENTSTDFDPSSKAADERSSKAADERCDVVLKTFSASHQLPGQGGLSETQNSGTLECLPDNLSPKMSGSKDRPMDESGVFISSNSSVNRHLPGGLDSPEERLDSSSPSAVVLEVQHKNLEESSPGPSVHERGTQTWKANPLYLLGNSDSDSNDSWQPEGSNVAWMEDLDNGKMLQEVKIRKVKRLEESQPSQKAEFPQAEAHESCRDKYKSDPERSKYSEGPSQYFMKDNEAARLEGKRSMNNNLTKSLSSGNFGLLSSSIISARPEQKDEIAVTSSPELHVGENLRSGEHTARDLDNSSICIQGDDIRSITSARAFSEARTCDEGRYLKSPLIISSQTVRKGFQEDEKAHFRHFLQEEKGEATLPPAGVYQTWGCDIDSEEVSISSQSEKSLKPEEKEIAPIFHISGIVCSGEMKRNEEYTQPLTRTCPVPLMKSDVEWVSSTEQISLPPNCAHNDQGEGKFLLDNIRRSTKSLEEELSICQCRSPLVSPMWRLTEDGHEAGTISLDEGIQGVEEQIGPSSMHTKRTFDGGKMPTSLTLPPASLCGRISGKETITTANICEDMLGEKNISNPLAGRIWKVSRLEAIDEEEQDPPKHVCDSISRPLTLRASFRPPQDIHWLPPKRNIRFMGIQTTSAHYPLENEKAKIKWDLTCDRPRAKSHNLGNEECENREDKMKKDTSRIQRRIQLWASLLRKLFKRTIMIR